MEDREFLQWIHDRLEHQFGVNNGTDYMRRLRKIIGALPETEKINDKGGCGMSDTYDGILKWESGSCNSCVGGNGDCDAWKMELEFNRTCDGNECFANALQLKGLIEEAESGAQKWVRDNTLFVCSAIDQCKTPACETQNVHKYDSSCCTEGCEGFKNPDTARKKCTPYRGGKTEEITWPGINGETHKEALKEIAPLLALHFVCSEVEKEHKKICRNRSTAWEAQCAGCPWGNLHDSYTADLICYEAEEWIEPVDAESRPEKEDRSDTEYNDKRQEIQEAALKIKEEDGGGVEYVVVKHISMAGLAVSDCISDAAFRALYNDGGFVRVVGACINRGDELYPYCNRLLDGGFIERKVDDYPANAGDYFAYKNTVWAVLPINGYLHLLGIKGAMLGEQTGLAILPNGNRMLSDHVRKDRLSEVKKVNVEISEVD